MLPVPRRDHKANNNREASMSLLQLMLCHKVNIVEKISSLLCFCSLSDKLLLLYYVLLRLFHYKTFPSSSRNYNQNQDSSIAQSKMNQCKHPMYTNIDTRFYFFNMNQTVFAPKPSANP